MFLYSDTILGKIFAVLIIIYCTFENVIYGLFACVIIIWFYQSDLLHRFKYKYNEHFTNLVPLNPQLVYSVNNPEKDIQSISTLDALSLDKVYSPELLPIKTESEQVFRHQYCSKELDIMYKTNKVIHKENIKQLFPELSFLEDIPCNPCDSTCRFKDNKMDKETELIPKQSRGNEESILQWANTWFIQKNEPYAGVRSSIASYLS
jgi:hypothetical protein